MLVGFASVLTNFGLEDDMSKIELKKQWSHRLLDKQFIYIVAWIDVAYASLLQKKANNNYWADHRFWFDECYVTISKLSHANDLIKTKYKIRHD